MAVSEEVKSEADYGHYAINVAYIPIADRFFFQILLGPYIEPIETVIVAKGQVDGEALKLHRLTPEAFDAILSLIRLKYPKHKLPLYCSKTGKGGWKRV